MARIGKLNVEVGADSKRMRGDFAKITKDVGKFKRDITRSGSFDLLGKTGTDIAKLAPSMRGLSKSLFAVGAAAGAAGVGLALVTKGQIEMIGDQADAAKKLGLTRNELVVLQRAGKAVGIENDKLTTSFERMADVVGSAFRGDAGAVKSIEGIGLKVKDLEKMSPAQRFMAIGKAINAIEDPAEKLSASKDIFGKAGGDMTNLFEGGAAAIRKAADELKSFGVLVSDKELFSIEGAGDAFDKMGTMLDGVKTKLAVEFSPIVEKIGRDLGDWVTSVGGMPAAMDQAMAKMNQGADVASKMGGSAVAAGKTAVDVKRGVWDRGKDLLGSLPGGGMVGDVLSWNPVRDTVGAIYGKHKSDQDLAAMQDRAALRMKTGEKPKTAMGTVSKFISDAKAESAAAFEGNPISEAKTTPITTPGYAASKPVGKDSPDLPKYMSKIPDGRQDYLDRVPMGEPAYVAKMQDSMSGAVSGDPVAKALGGEVVAELRRTNTLLERVASNTKGPLVGTLG